MFAYCPNINQKICGVEGGTDSGNMMLYADQAKVKKVESNDLVDLKQGFDIETERGVGSEEAQYDACHYEITMGQVDLDKWIPKEIKIKLTKKSEKLNVYIWEGKSR